MFNMRKISFKYTGILAVFISIFLVSCTREPTFTKTYSIQNPIDGTYTVNCTAYEGYPDDTMDVDILYNEEKIISIFTQFNEYNYPIEMIYLFEFDSCKYYYIGYVDRAHIMITHENNNSGMKNKKDDFYLNSKYYSSSQDYKELSGIINKNVTSKDIKEKFHQCNYNPKKIIELMSFYGEDKESTT